MSQDEPKTNPAWETVTDDAPNVMKLSVEGGTIYLVGNHPPLFVADVKEGLSDMMESLPKIVDDMMKGLQGELPEGIVRPFTIVEPPPEWEEEDLEEDEEASDELLN